MLSDVRCFKGYALASLARAFTGDIISRCGGHLVNEELGIDILPGTDFDSRSRRRVGVSHGFGIR